MSEPRPMDDEERRILRAVGAGTMRTNEHGRYVIDGAMRPAPRARERLQWTFGYISAPPRNEPVRLTVDGRHMLRELDALCPSD